MKAKIRKCLWLISSILISAVASEPWNIIGILALDRSIDRIVFLDDTTGWACANFPGVVKTNDGGNIWTVLSSNLPSTNIFAVYFTSKDRGWAVGVDVAEDRANATILFTKDGGRSWEVRKHLPERWGLRDVFFINERRGWAVGINDRQEAVIFSTMDGGVNWKEQFHGFSPSELIRVRFADHLNGWTIGHGIVLHTNNGGMTWKPQGFRDDPFINGLSVLDKDNAWIAGGPDALYRTVNGGKKWTRVKIPSDPPFAYLHSIAFANIENGWVCGKDGIIFSTKNRGLTWSKESSPVSSFLWDIAVIKTKLFFGTEEGRILVKMR
jgi:photosystem II stability/assembly factor-like uncharacterized protein